MFPLRDTIRSRSLPVMNYVLIGLNALVFLFQSSLSERGFNLLVRYFGLVPADFSILRPISLLTVFTSMFMHGNWFHLISNMWTLYIFGDNIEDRMGHLRYLVFYLLGGTAAALAHVFLSPRLAVPTVGASGAVAAVLGAYFVLYPGARVVTFIPFFFLPWFVDIPAFFYLGMWFFSQLANGLLANQVMSGIAWWAHIGGFLFGMLLVRKFIRRPRVEIYTHQGENWPFY